jgi:hypothetical protein
MRPMLAAALIVLSLAGCTWTNGSAGPSSAAVVVGGNGQQRALMEHILHELGPSSIERVWIGNPPHQGRAGVPDGPHWLALRIRAHTGLNDTRDLPGRAQAMIAADLFARSSAASGLPAISGASLHLHTADGRRLYATSWHTTPPRSKLLGWSLQGRSLRAAIARDALASGLGIGSIRVIGAPVRAVEVVVTTASPAGLRLRLDHLAAALAARPLVISYVLRGGRPLRHAGRRRGCGWGVGRPALDVPEPLDCGQGRGDMPAARARLLTQCVRLPRERHHPHRRALVAPGRR